MYFRFLYIFLNKNFDFDSCNVFQFFIHLLKQELWFRFLRCISVFLCIFFDKISQSLVAVAHKSWGQVRLTLSNKEMNVEVNDMNFAPQGIRDKCVRINFKIWWNQFHRKYSENYLYLSSLKSSDLWLSYLCSLCNIIFQSWLGLYKNLLASPEGLNFATNNQQMLSYFCLIF